jgi:GNAT superfamily N-acetyltransferase
MKIQAITNKDISGLTNLQPEDWPDIIPEFDYYLKKDFCNPIKAISDNEIVGIGVSIIFKRTCWLAHIIVHESYRNKGIGSQITEKLLYDNRCNSVDSYLLIATELGFPVYKKAGFRIVAEYKYLMRYKSWGDLQISPAIIPYDDRFHSTIMELDNNITGEDRSPLLTDYLQNTLVYMENNSIYGFYMPELGEGLILSDTTKAGLELMKKKYSSVDKAVLPSDNQSGIDFLLQSGFEVVNTRGIRMIKGDDINWNPQKVFSRIGGNYG